MITSMTGFARRHVIADMGDVFWEIRSVNHRYLDISTRLPESFRDMEMVLRDKVKEKIYRGKIEINLVCQSNGPLASLTKINIEQVRYILNLSEQIGALMQAPKNLTVKDMLTWPGVLVTDDDQLQRLEEKLLGSFDELLDDFIAMRSREGEKIQILLLDRLDKITQEAGKARQLVPAILEQQQAKLRERIARMDAMVDEGRIESEVAFFAQKIDIAEEIDRLIAHVDEVKNVIISGGNIGRRLDFLMQELHREANTLGSKSIDQRTSSVSVELKVLIEQMREQVQNIE